MHSDKERVLVEASLVYPDDRDPFAVRSDGERSEDGGSSPRAGGSPELPSRRSPEASSAGRGARSPETPARRDLKESQED